MRYVVKQAIEFKKWYLKENKLAQAKMQERFYNIENYGHFGDMKRLFKDLFELRWRDGRRVYFTIIRNEVVLLLIGGSKHEQKKDIQKAKRNKEKYC